MLAISYGRLLLYTRNLNLGEARRGGCALFSARTRGESSPLLTVRRKTTSSLSGSFFPDESRPACIWLWLAAAFCDDEVR